MKDWIKDKIYRRFNISFSKSGDDIQLYKLLKATVPGTYVDVGCWHPLKYSNTYYFYLRNWRGICIDPNPELAALYRKFRPTDTFVNNAIGRQPGELTYYMLDDANSSMNTLDFSQIQKNRLESHVKKQLPVPLRPLADILTEQLKPGERLDFFDVDVEGLDLEVLQSNDWNRFRPKVVAIETNQSLHDDMNSHVTGYMAAQSYELVGKTVIHGHLGNLFFIDQLLK